MKNLKLIFVVFLFYSCFDKSDKKTLLTADREAPLGWVYLRLYVDKSFEFESRGLERKGEIFSGNYEVHNDTILFHYSDKVPKVGSLAIIKGNYIRYINGKYPENLEIKSNNLNK